MLKSSFTRALHPIGFEGRCIFGDHWNLIPVHVNPEIPHRALSGEPRTLESRNPCSCYQRNSEALASELFFHSEKQDTTGDGWKHLLELIEKAAADQRPEFDPLEDLALEERRQIVTLPSSIAKLKQVRNLNLYDSNLVRIPPEIGDMTNLQIFTPYTSYRLHWFPYEITRCKKLTQTLVSTRALLGNKKHRPPFPELQPGRDSTAGMDLSRLSPDIWGTDAISHCSVCNRSLKEAGLHQVWISLWVAAYDVLPLLVNACSPECILALPAPPKDYAQKPHKGGRGVDQPPPRFGPLV